MNFRYTNLWIAPLIGFISFFLLNEDPYLRFFGAIIITTLVLLILLITQSIFDFIRTLIFGEQPFLRREKKFVHQLLKLAALITKVDGQILTSEKEKIKQRLFSDFKTEKAQKYYESYLNYLQEDVNLKKVCKKINQEFTKSSKNHLFYFLIELAIADGELSKAEINLLQTLCKQFNFPPQTLISILNLFNYKSESQKDSNKRRYNNQKKSSGRADVYEAYKILNVTNGTNMQGVKKAYRKLAKIHHPDKVSHLGPVIQDKAKEKFQLINQAYEKLIIHLSE